MQENKLQQSGLDRERAIAVAREGAALLRTGELARAEKTFAELDRLAERAPRPREARPGVRLATARCYLAWLEELVKEQRYGHAITAADVVLERYAAYPPPDDGDCLARATRFRAIAFANSGEHEVAEAILRDLLEQNDRDDRGDLQAVAALALSDLAYLRGKTGDSEAAIGMYSELERKFADADDPELRHDVAVALHDQIVLLRERNDYQAALEAADRLIAWLPHEQSGRDEPLLVDARFARIVLLRALGHLADAARERDRFICEFEESTANLARKWVAQALSEKANVLFDGGNFEEAVAVNDRLIELARGEPHRELRRFLALGMSARAQALEKLERWTEVDQNYDEMVALLDDASEVDTQEQVARALARNAIAMRAQGHLDRALGRCEQILASFSSQDTGDAVSSVIARAHLEQVELLTLTRSGEAAVAADAARMLVADLSLPESLRARIMSSSAAAYVDGERFQDAVLLVDELVQAFGASDDETIGRQVALALDSKLAALAAMGLEEETKRAYDQMVAHFGEQVVEAHRAVAEELRGAVDQRSRMQLATLLCKQAMVLNDLGKDNEALTVIDGFIEGYEAEKDPVLRKFVVEARATREKWLKH
jgi:tetratricopeptide (TPR) repeat protein